MRWLERPFCTGEQRLIASHGVAISLFKERGFFRGCIGRDTAEVQLSMDDE